MSGRPRSFRSLRARWCVGLALAPAAAGCGSSDAGSDAQGTRTSSVATEPGVVASLCPSCEPRIGGQSSDFEGDQDVCFEFLRRRTVSFDEAEAANLDIASVRALVSREFTAPLSWADAKRRLAHPAPAAALPPSGFRPQTTIHGVMSIASDVVLAELDPERCDADSRCANASEQISCANYMASVPPTIELTLELETGDAAIERASLSGSLRLLPGRALLAELAGDLGSARGTLRVGSGLPEPQSGELIVRLGFWSSGVRGVLQPVLYVPVERGDVEGPILESYAPLQASWPGDPCSSSELPLDEQTPEGRAALERLAAEYPVARARVDDNPLLDVNWFDVPGAAVTARRTRIGLELLGNPRPSCVNAIGEPHFDIDVHVWSEDGRLDWTLPARGELRRDPGKEPALRLSGDARFASNDEFWSTRLKDVDLWGAPEADVYLTAGYKVDPDDPPNIGGSLAVSAVPDCVRDSTRCGNLETVMRIQWPQ